jgi:hypothetical protein
VWEHCREGGRQRWLVSERGMAAVRQVGRAIIILRSGVSGREGDSLGSSNSISGRVLMQPQVLNQTAIYRKLLHHLRILQNSNMILSHPVSLTDPSTSYRETLSNPQKSHLNSVRTLL